VYSVSECALVKIKPELFQPRLELFTEISGVGWNVLVEDESVPVVG